MVAQRRFTDHQDHYIPVPGTDLKALPAAVFYGANGAGKSNLTRALEFGLNLVKTGIPRDTPVPVQPFRFGGVEGQPSKFEWRFATGGKVFCYGFELDLLQVRSEWLDLYEGEKAHPLFERATTKEGTVKLEVTQRLHSDSAKISALSVVGVRRNQLFLSLVQEAINPEEMGVLATNALDWMNQFMVISPDEHFSLGCLLSMDESTSQFVSDYLRDAGTGLEAIEIRTHPVEHLIDEDHKSELRAKLERSPGDGVEHIRLENGERCSVQLDSDGKLVTRDVVACHRTATGDTVRLAMEEHSDGTQRLAELLPALHLLQSGECVFVIDELDRSLHPLLALKFLDSFLRLHRGRPAQLIVTTHETHLLDLEVLRRDEIWFAEKSEAGATHLYPLADFPVRTDLRVDKHYLQGRFGAIPFLGGIDALLERTEAAKSA